MEMILAGLATAFNFAVLKWKVENNRKIDAMLDLAMTLIAIGIESSALKVCITLGTLLIYAICKLKLDGNTKLIGIAVVRV